ncbi:MAG: hypothetical protein HY461_02215 [Parcubacteria group bacterium]|nr:hypothetical protein [Parcubacteria group bacterium]
MKTIQSLDEIKNVPAHQRFAWYIPESLTTIYPIQDNGEALVDVREMALNQRIPLLFSDVDKIYYLRRSVAERLLPAALATIALSSSQRTIKISDAFRPLALQREYFHQIEAEISAKEKLTGRALWERVTQFIADPDLCPPHSTGGAIDCTIADMATGEERDMGTPLDTISDLAYTFTEKITPQQMRNRQELFSVMIAAGFANLATEWWHFSFGDQYWAIFYGQTCARYRSLEQASP